MNEPPEIIKYLAYAAILADAVLLATFFYPPTLETYMRWADFVVGFGK